MGWQKFIEFGRGYVWVECYLHHWSVGVDLTFGKKWFEFEISFGPCRVQIAWDANPSQNFELF